MPILDLKPGTTFNRLRPDVFEAAFDPLFTRP